MPSAGSPPPNPEQIRDRAAEILARDEYDLEAHGREGSWLIELLATLLEWLLAPFRWIFQMTAGLPEVFRWLIVLGSFVLLVLIVWHMIWSILKAVRGDRSQLQTLAATRRRQVTPEELEEEAAAAGSRGDYVTAMRRLFRAAVLRLERSDKRPLRPGTTNRALLRRYGDRPTTGEALRFFVEMIDRKWYGDEPCSESDYAACRSRTATSNSASTEGRMFNVRNAVIGSIGVLVLIVAGGVISALQTPDSDGLAIETYGTHWDGYRGLYELLDELGTPVERRLLPPSPEMARATTLVLAQPDLELVSLEPAYLQALGPWIEQGGRIVVTPRVMSQREMLAATIRGRPVPQIDVLEALGVEGVTVRRVMVERPGPQGSGRGTTAGTSPVGPGGGGPSGGPRSGKEEFDEVLRKFWVPQQVVPLEAAFTATGTLAHLANRANRIVIDEKKRAHLELDVDVTPAGVLSYEAAGERRIVAASFTKGAGEVVVLADELATANMLLGRADNAIIAYDLTAGGGRSVVFDEFYHGLAIRGNIFWLLTQPGYGLAAIAGMTLLGLIIWRRGILLGPPLSSASKSRRTITEYVDAMSRFFHRARGSRIFILTEVRAGVLRMLAQRTGLPPGHADVERVAAALDRRSPGEARRFVEAMKLVDAALARAGRCSEAEALVALEGISTCL